MTLPLPVPFKPAAVVGALAWATLAVGTAVAPVAAQAASAAPYYTAQLAAPASARTAVAGGLIWTCDGSTCTAARGTSRPAIVCARLAREVGPVTAFVADGKALAAEDLARCKPR